MSDMNSNQSVIEKEEKQEKAKGSAWKVVLLLGAVLVALVLAIHAGIVNRVAAETSLAKETQETAIQSVSVVHPQMTAPSEEIALPGTIQAFTDAPIYARTNGYLKKWYVDIGSRVKAGELLADIETPEVDQQLQQAKADLETAQANYNLAQTTAARWQHLLKSDSVSKQETDEKVGDMAAKKAMADSAASNVHRLQDLQSYEKVFAPFDGVITARNTDLGDLINSGAGTPGRELFHLAALDRLRVFVNVPEVYERAAQAGARANLTLDEFPGRTFAGTIVRNANSIDTASRTLLVEVDVENPTRQLLPGAYVTVHLKLGAKVSGAVTIPVNTMLFRSEGLRVAVVRNGKAQLVPITVGRDYGNSVEVVAGLSPREQIIVNPSDSLVSGAQVRVSEGE